MLKYWTKNDNYKRSFYVPNEMKKNVLKNLLASYLSNLNAKLFYSRKFWNVNSFSSISRYRHSCSFLGSSRSVFFRFKLSRHQVKAAASNGYLIGMRKSSF